MRKGFTLYTFENGETQEYVTSKTAAIRGAKAALKLNDHLDEIEIDKCETVPITLDALIDILRTNGGSWCVKSETVATVRRNAKDATP